MLHRINQNKENNVIPNMQ